MMAQQPNEDIMSAKAVLIRQKLRLALEICKNAEIKLPDGIMTHITRQNDTDRSSSTTIPPLYASRINNNQFWMDAAKTLLNIPTSKDSKFSKQMSMVRSGIENRIHYISPETRPHIFFEKTSDIPSNATSVVINRAPLGCLFDIDVKRPGISVVIELLNSDKAVVKRIVTKGEMGILLYYYIGLCISLIALKIKLTDANTTDYTDCEKNIGEAFINLANEVGLDSNSIEGDWSGM